MTTQATRIEHDLLGEKAVPADAYYGVQTARALENFHISGVELRLYPNVIKAFAMVKLAAARANVDCKPHHFRQFAVMGDLYARYVLGIERPRIGLLSIGEEDTKGTDTTKEVFKVLSGTTLNFIGNVEGNHVYSGKVDVIITDGFSGNISLKVTESIVSSLNVMVRREVAKSMRAKLGAWLMMPALRAIQKKTDYEEYGGAPLLGARECVIICHGRSSPKAIKNAVRVAREFVVNCVARHIHDGIRTLAEAESRFETPAVGEHATHRAGGAA
jgi:glycerol-3-phosphate acyltransferase PlsX